MVAQARWFRQNLDRSMSLVASVEQSRKMEQQLRSMLLTDPRTRIRPSKIRLIDLDKLEQDARDSIVPLDLDALVARRDELRAELQRRQDMLAVLEALGQLDKNLQDE